MPFQLPGVGDVRLRFVVGADDAHPLLVPPDLVEAVVVAAAARDGDFIEIGLEKEGGGGALATCRSAEDSDPVDVHK